MIQGTPEEIANRFAYHAPKDEDTKNRHEHVRNTLHVTAQGLMAVVPECRERAVMLTKLEEAMFWANAGIARNQ